LPGAVEEGKEEVVKIELCDEEQASKQAGSKICVQNKPKFMSALLAATSEWSEGVRGNFLSSTQHRTHRVGFFYTINLYISFAILSFYAHLFYCVCLFLVESKNYWLSLSQCNRNIGADLISAAYDIQMYS
jgi:hypothetical protein